MTALNCFVTTEAVHIATDGAGYLVDGSPCGQNQKVAILGHLPAVIAIRGPVALIHAVTAGVAPSFRDFDAMIAAAPDSFRSIHAAYVKTMEAGGHSAFIPRAVEFVIGGYSNERRQVEAYLLSSGAQGGLKPWTICQVPDDIISPMSDGVAAAIGNIASEVGAPWQDPEAWALRLMEAQRAHKLPLENGHEVVAAGAFCQLTTLTRDGITTRVLKRWE